MRPQQHITDDSDECIRFIGEGKLGLTYCYKVYVMYLLSQLQVLYLHCTLYSTLRRGKGKHFKGIDNYSIQYKYYE